jgi:uncharacterized phage-like protein YoqJ
MKKPTFFLLSCTQARKRFDGEFETVIFDQIYQKLKSMIRQGCSLFILGGSLRGKDAKTVAEVIAKLKIQHLGVDFHFAGSMRSGSKDVWH